MTRLRHALSAHGDRLTDAAHYALPVLAGLATVAALAHGPQPRVALPLAGKVGLRAEALALGYLQGGCRP